MNITHKKGRLTDTENKLVVTSGEGEGRGNRGVGDKEAQTITWKISHKEILHNMGNIANIL